MNDATAHNSVGDLFRDIVEDEQFLDETRQLIERRRLATVLFSMRCRHKMTQQQVADKLGKTQGYVSKLEHSSPEQITVSELEAYARALDVALTISFQPRATVAQMVKHHFFQIVRHLDTLCDLAGDDEDLKSGVDRFINEWLGNTIKRALDDKLKIGRLIRRIPASQEQHLRVEAPEDDDDAKLRQITERHTAVG